MDIGTLAIAFHVISLICIDSRNVSGKLRIFNGHSPISVAK
jgi:hypothetical protein